MYNANNEQRNTISNRQNGIAQSGHSKERMGTRTLVFGKHRPSSRMILKESCKSGQKRKYFRPNSAVENELNE